MKKLLTPRKWYKLQLLLARRRYKNPKIKPSDLTLSLYRYYQEYLIPLLNTENSKYLANWSICTIILANERTLYNLGLNYQAIETAKEAYAQTKAWIRLM